MLRAARDDRGARPRAARAGAFDLASPAAISTRARSRRRRTAPRGSCCTSGARSSQAPLDADLARARRAARRRLRGSRMTPTSSTKILATKRAELANITNERRLAVIEAAEAMPHAAAVSRRARAGRAGAPMRVIAEIKRASPSAGPIRPGADPADDRARVRGRRRRPRSACSPTAVLRRRPRVPRRRAPRVRAAAPAQGLHDRSAPDRRGARGRRRCGAADRRGASGGESSSRDCVLRRRAGSGSTRSSRSTTSASSIARSPRGATLIGVNHRDLRTFAIDMTLTERIAKRVPAGTSCSSPRAGSRPPPTCAGSATPARTRCSSASS